MNANDDRLTQSYPNDTFMGRGVNHHKDNANERLAQGHADEYESAAKKPKAATMNTVDTSEDQTKLAEHYRVLCVRLTEKLEKSTSKADKRKKRIQELEEECKELKIENAALKLKSTECNMKNTDESKQAKTQNKEMIPTDSSEDYAEMKNNARCKSNELSWRTRFEELAIYKKVHGNCNVSERDEANKSLGHWVVRQRKTLKAGKLSEKRIAQLNTLGFVWEGHNHDAFWTTSYNNLVAYKAKHGHCNVSKDSKRNKSLGHWVMNQRTAFKNGKLSKERIAKLNELGFVWEVRKNDACWTSSYSNLVTYKAAHGHCNVSQRNAANKSLGSWVNNQRTAFKNGTLSDERIAQLNELGFAWEMRNHDASWTSCYNNLVAYKELNGHCNVARDDEANNSLSNWVYAQRKAFKKGKLSEDRMKKLNGIGFVWNMKSQQQH